jgi:hypothetical protein
MSEVGRWYSRVLTRQARRGSPNLLSNGSVKRIIRTLFLIFISENPFISSAHCLYHPESSELCTIQADATPD